MIIAMSTPSACEIHGPRLPYHDHLDLTRVLQLLLETPSDLLAHVHHPLVVDPLRVDHDPDLPARLDREAALDALEALGDLFDLLQPLDVRLEHLTPRAGARSADRICGRDQARLGLAMWLLVVVRLDRVQHRVGPVVLLAEVPPQLDVRPLVLVLEPLADV